MAKVSTTERLIELVKRSELVSKEDFATFLAERSTRLRGLLPAAPDGLASDLVEAGLITPWQMDQLMKGKYRGFRVGKYTLQGHLGTGGMSSVYLSEHPIMRRPVAIKVLPKSRVAKSSYLERFELEARAVAALDHPNIVRAYDIDNEGDTHYIVMEYVEGLDLQRMVERDGPLEFERAADFIAQAAVGLQHAHDAGVVHRDIKPANCLVDPTGTVKVLDMGLAKFSHDETSLSAVHKDSVVGTADYLAPEQAVNSSKVDHRADVYGLGGTLYFLLVGHPPFPEGTLTERLLKHQKEEPASIYSKRPDAPATLIDICRRMMLKNPETRIQTAAAVAAELRQWLDGRTGGGSGSKTGLGRLSALSNSPSGSNRWQQMIKTAPNPPPISNAPGDTVSGKHGDTARIGDDDLTLAPIEDEEQQKRPKSSQSTAEATSAAESSGSIDVDVHDDHLLSQIENELGQSSSTSGSLVDLLENPALSNVSTSQVTLKLTKSKRGPAVWLIVAAGAAAALVVGLIAILMFGP
ncbi:MAG: serine/threonine protein kinase [Planctomycetales bacterium]|nr:serine/threonine protein kinase [Planctomycetales bacterium]